MAVNYNATHVTMKVVITGLGRRKQI